MIKFKKEIFYFTLFIASVFLITYLFDILLPFFIGIFIAFLLDPIVDWFENKKLNRAFGTTVVLIIFIVIISMITLLILPLLLSQIKSFLIDFPEVTNNLNKKINLLINYFQKKIVFTNASSNINEFLPNITDFFTGFLRKIISSSLAIFNIISLLLLTPIVSWYFLKDWDKILKSTFSVVPPKYKTLTIDYARNINTIFDSYLRGQILVSIILSFFYFLSFYFLGLNYSLFVGIFAGSFSFIPFVGIIISLFITSMLTYLQFMDVYLLLYVVLIFFMGQLLESNFLTPKLIGKKLGLHPLIVLLAIFIFGALFGILGIIFATPLMATIILILKRNIISK